MPRRSWIYCASSGPSACCRTTISARSGIEIEVIHRRLNGRFTTTGGQTGERTDGPADHGHDRDGDEVENEKTEREAEDESDGRTDRGTGQHLRHGLLDLIEEALLGAHLAHRIVGRADRREREPG